MAWKVFCRGLVCRNQKPWASVTRRLPSSSVPETAKSTSVSVAPVGRNPVWLAITRSGTTTLPASTRRLAWTVPVCGPP